MALTLTADLGVPTTLAPAIRLTITGTVPDVIEAGYLFRLEDEVLELKYFGKTEETILGGAAQQTVDDRNVWYARRGVDNTAIVSHIATTAVKGVADALLAGTTEVVPAPPFGESGGGTSDHTALTNREAAEGHPQSAITGLVDALAAAGDGSLLPTADQKAALDEATTAGPGNPFLTLAETTLAAVIATDPGVPADTDIYGPVGAGGHRGELHWDADGTFWMARGPSKIVLHPNGDMELITDAGAHIKIDAAGGIYLNGNTGTNFAIADTGAMYLQGVPTADPTDAGQVWIDAGTVKVSAG